MKKTKEKNEKKVEKKKEKNFKKKSPSQENMQIAFFTNLMFSILEIVGGFLTNSISIFSDAIHDFGDSISIGISYLLERKSTKEKDSKYTYGYLRYSLIGAVITSAILLISSVIIIYNSISRMVHPEKINYDAMIIFAIFGILINGYAAYKTSRSKKYNEKFINLHMLEDVFGWVAILIGSILIKTANLIIIDPILSILIALFILYHIYKNMKNIFNIFMEKVPSNIKLEDIKLNIEKDFDSIENIHHIHIWSIDEENVCMTAHVKLNKDLPINSIIELKKKLKDKLKEKSINHVTLEIEYLNENCDSKTCK